MLELIVALVGFCSNHQCVSQKLGNTTILTICSNDVQKTIVSRYEEGDKTLTIVLQDCTKI